MAHRFQHVETAVVMVDIAIFAILFAVGLFSAGFGLLWIAALRGISPLGHFIPLMPTMLAYAYANAIALWRWPMLLILGRTTWLHDTRRKTRSFSPS